MRGSVGSNVNRRKLTAKYSKKTTSTPAKDIVVSTSNKSLTTSTVPTRGQQRVTSQSITKEQPVRKIVPASTEVSPQGIVTTSKKSDIPTTFIGEEIYKEKDEDGVATGKWDQQKQLKGIHPIEKFIRGIVSPYEQPAQMVKNIADEISPEQQMVQDTAIDLAINPVLETLAGAKQYGLTQKDFYWPDQLTGIDHPSMPAFLRTGGGSGSDILGGLANNLGYIADVATHKDSASIISEKFVESGERFSQQPAYYVGSAIGEIPLWFIGVGQAKAVATITSKSAMATIKIAAATGKLPGPRAIKDIIKVESAHSNMNKEIIKTTSSLVNKGKVSKGFDKAVKSVVKLVSKDLDIEKVEKIKNIGREKDALDAKQRVLNSEIKTLQKQKNKLTDVIEKRKIKLEIKTKTSQVKNLKKQWSKKENLIKLTVNNMEGPALKRKFNRLSKDKSLDGQTKYWEAVDTDLKPIVQTKFDELPNQVSVLKTIRKEHLEGKQADVMAKAKTILGNDKVDNPFWEATKSDPEQYINNLSPKKQYKLLKLRKKYTNLQNDIDVTMDQGYTPWGKTISNAAVFPSKVSSRWKNTWATTSIEVGDSGVKLPIKQSHTGWSGSLRKIVDYHLDNISEYRKKETNFWAKQLSGKIAEIGYISEKDIKTTKAKTISHAEKLQKDNIKLEKEILDIESDSANKGGISENNQAVILKLESKISDNETIINKIVDYNKSSGEVRSKAFDDTIGATLIPGAGKKKNTFYFEPEFLKSSMGDDYKKLLPKEIIYASRPLASLRKEDGMIKGTIGSKTIGNQMEVIIRRTPMKPAGKLRRTARRFKPRIPKIRDKYLTLDNSQVILFQRKYNPTGSMALRIPKNAPEDVKKLLQKAKMKPVKQDEQGSNPLFGLTGGENYDIWKTVDYTPSTQQKSGDFSKLYSTDTMNVGTGYKYATDDGSAYIPRTFDEVEDARAFLRGDSSKIEANLRSTEYNISIKEKILRDLNDKQFTPESNIPDSPIIGTPPPSTKFSKTGKSYKEAEKLLLDNKKLKQMIDDLDLKNIKSSEKLRKRKIWNKQIARNQIKIDKLLPENEQSVPISQPKLIDNSKEIKTISNELTGMKKRRDELNIKLANSEKLKEKFADYGIGFPSQRGAVTVIDGNVLKTQREVGQRTVLRDDTGALYLFAQINNKRKVFKIRDLEVLNKIRPDSEIEFGTKIPDAVIGINEKGVVERAVLQGDKTGKTGKPQKDDIFKYLGTGIGGRSQKKSVSQYIKEQKIIRLGDSDRQVNSFYKKILKDKWEKEGVVELTPKQVQELDSGPTFSGLVDRIDDHLNNRDYTPTVTTGDSGKQIASKTFKQQITEYIGTTGRKKVSSTLSGTSKKMDAAKRALLLKDKKWSIVSSPITSTSEEGLTLSDRVMKGGIYELGIDELTNFQKQIASDSDPLLNVLDDGTMESSSYAVIPSTLGDKKIKGLDIFNVVDMAVIGGRNQDELTSDMLRASVARRINQRFKQSGKNQNKYEEMTFAAEQMSTGKPRIKSFRHQLLQAYKLVDDTKKGEKDPKPYTTEQVNDILKYGEDDAGIEKFEGSDDWDKIVEDITSNDMLREMTKKEKILAYSKPGRKPAGKKIEQRAGIISPSKNFGDLHKYLPNNSLASRTRDKITNRLQSTDTWLSDTTGSDPNLLSGFFGGITNKYVTPRFSKRIQNDPAIKQGFIEAVEFAQGKGIKISKKYINEYNRIKSQVSSPDLALRRIETRQDEFGMSELNVRGTYNTGSYAQAKLTESEILQINNIQKKLNILDFGDDKAKSELGITFKVRDEDGHLSNINIMDLNKKHIGASDVSDNVGTQDFLVRRTQMTRLNQVKVELSLEKSRIEKKFIDVNEYSSYKHTLEDLYNAKTQAHGNKQKNQILHGGNIDKINANIRWIKERQGKPSGVNLSPEELSLVDNTDLAITITSPSPSIISSSGKTVKATVNNLNSSSLPDSMLKTVQDKGYLNTIPGYEKVKKWNSKKRAEAWDSAIIKQKGEPDNKHQVSMLEKSGFDVEEMPSFDFNSINKITNQKTGDVRYAYTLPFKKDASKGIKTLDDWDNADLPTKQEIYRNSGELVEETTASLEFRHNRTKIPQKLIESGERLNLIIDPMAKDTIDALKKFKSNRKALGGKYSRKKNIEEKRLGLLVKPPTEYEGRILLYSSVKNAKAKLPSGKMSTFEWQTSDVNFPRKTQTATSELRAQAFKISMLEKMGIDEAAYTSVKTISRLLRNKQTSQSNIQTQLAKFNSAKKGSKSSTSATKIINQEKLNIAGYDSEIDKLKAASKTQSTTTTLQSTKPSNIGSNPRQKFWSFGAADYSPNYLGDYTGGVGLGPFIPSAFATSTPVLNTQQSQVIQQSQSTPKIDTSVSPKSSESPILQTPVKPQLDITSGLNLGSLQVPNMILNTRTGMTTKGILDSNLGWLAAQLPSQITTPQTRVESISSLTSVMKSGSQLKTSTLLKLEQSFRLKTRLAMPIPGNTIFKKKPIDSTFNVYKRKTQVITPIMFGAAPWEAAEERRRKRKKKPKRKAAKTWWQTPENWYESNYWGKSGTGSGYVTFKGSEPKRLKDRKNQFGF